MKKRPRLPDDELHKYEDTIADASLIGRLMKRLGITVSLGMPDDDLRGLSYDDVRRAKDAADRIRHREIDWMHRRKDEVTGDD